MDHIVRFVKEELGKQGVADAKTRAIIDTIGAEAASEAGLEAAAEAGAEAGAEAASEAAFFAART